MRTVYASMAVAVLLCCPARAATDKFNITPAEHQACDADAATLCGNAKNEDQVIACMKAERPQLTGLCRSAFDSGLRKRHIPL